MIWVVHAMPCHAMQSKAKNLSYLSLDIGANCFSSKLELPTHIQVFKWMGKRGSKLNPKAKRKGFKVPSLVPQNMGTFH
jgi:hypothetical protein